MKPFTHIKFNPEGDSYDVYFVDDKLLMQGDDYHDKVSDMFEGIKLYLNEVLNEEFSVVEMEAKTKNGDEFWNYDYNVDSQIETLRKYLKRICKDFTLIEK